MWQKYGQIFKCDVSTAQCDNGTIKCEGKKKRITECDKSTVACNVGNAQCDNEIVKCEEKIQVPPNVRNVRSNVILKKVKESPNVIKELSYVILKPHNVRMELSNVRKKK